MEGELADESGLPLLCSCRRLGRLTGLGADTLFPVASNLAWLDLGESIIKGI